MDDSEKFFDKLKKFIIQLFISYFQPTIFAVVDIIAVSAYNFLKKTTVYEMIISILIGVISILAFSLGFIIRRKSNFHWGYIFKSLNSELTLSANSAKWDDKMLIKPKGNLFKGFMEGEYDWENVEITNVQLKCKSSSIKFSDIQGKNICENANTLNITQSPNFAKYTVNFGKNWSSKDPVEIIMNMNYNKANLERILFLDIYRPTKTMKLRFLVDPNLPIKNVRYHKFKLYGEKDEAKTLGKDQKYLASSGKVLKAKKEVGTDKTVYEVKVKNPKMFYQYSISWDWRD